MWNAAARSLLGGYGWEIEMLRAIGCIVVGLALIGLLVVAGVFKMIF